MKHCILDRLRSRGLEPRHQAATHGGEWASPCPLCGGRDRFRIWPDQEGGPACAQSGVRGTWYCRRCGKGGDALQFLMDVERLSFPEACRALRLELPERHGLPRVPRPDVRRTFLPREAGLPSAAWREQAAKLVQRAQTALLRDRAMLDWLERRGVPESAVRRFHLGLVQGERGRMGMIRPRSVWGLEPRQVRNQDGSVTMKKALFIARGLLIPSFGPDNEPRSLRVRRSAKDVAQWGDKYMVVEGSAMTPLLLGRDLRAVVVVEAELDALAVAAWAGDLAGALAVLTNRGKPDAATHARLSRALRILVALDFDKAGAQGWSWWRETYASARRWPVPEGKDPGDYVGLGGDLRGWVRAGLPPALTLGASEPVVQISGAAKAVIQATSSQDEGLALQSASVPQPGTELRELAKLLRRKFGCLWLSSSGGGKMLGGQIDAEVLPSVSALLERSDVLPKLLEAGRPQEDGLVIVDAVDISRWLRSQAGSRR